MTCRDGATSRHAGPFGGPTRSGRRLVKLQVGKTRPRPERRDEAVCGRELSNTANRPWSNDKPSPLIGNIHNLRRPWPLLHEHIKMLGNFPSRCPASSPTDDDGRHAAHQHRLADIPVPLLREADYGWPSGR